MLKHPVIAFLLVLYPVLLPAQELQNVLYFPLQQKDLKVASASRKVFERNGITTDSLFQIINHRILQNLKTKSPDINLIIAKPEIINAVYDSSTLDDEFTSEHVKKINSSKGWKKIRSKQAGSEARYYSRKLAVPGQVLIRSELLNSNATLCVFINRLLITKNKPYGFTVHYEFYDRDYNLLMGNKYNHTLQADRKMYFSTIRFYLDYSIDNFCDRMTSMIKKFKAEPL